MGRTAVMAALCGAALLLPSRSLACVGDCDADGRVVVSELVRGVELALVRGDVPAVCAALDANASAAIEVFELVAAVQTALQGCPDEPSATPTPLFTATPTEPAAAATASPPATAAPLATETPIGARCRLVVIPERAAAFGCGPPSTRQGTFRVEASAEDCCWTTSRHPRVRLVPAVGCGDQQIDFEIDENINSYPTNTQISVRSMDRRDSAQFVIEQSRSCRPTRTQTKTRTRTITPTLTPRAG